MIQKIIKQILARLFYLRSRIAFRKKIKKILNNIKIDVKFVNPHRIQYLKYWNKLDKHANYSWSMVYSSVNGIIDHRYVSEITYYNIIEPILNNAIFAEAYSDKNNYHRFIKNEYLPSIFLRCIQNVFFDEGYHIVDEPERHFKNLLLNNNQLVCKKAIETGGGADVVILWKQGDCFVDNKQQPVSLNQLKIRLGESFLIQEYIYQHPFFSQFNPSSVNTIRLFTYRSVIDNQIHVLHSVFRIGQKGALVDNQASGGISCGINCDTGTLNTFAIDKYGNKYKESNGYSFYNLSVPKYAEMKNIAIETAILFPYHRLLGFDFAFDRNGLVRVIEVNNKNNEVNFYQMNNGSLFGHFTEEVISHCKNSKRYFKLDFEI
jgi:hypothetical protein